MLRAWFLIVGMGWDSYLCMALRVFGLADSWFSSVGDWSGRSSFSDMGWDDVVSIAPVPF